MKTKNFYAYLMMFMVSVCTISCDKDESIEPIKRGDKVLTKMEINYDYYHSDDGRNDYNTDIVTYSYDGNGNITKIDYVNTSNSGATRSYMVEGKALTSDHFIDCKLNDAKYITNISEYDILDQQYECTYHSNGYLKSTSWVLSSRKEIAFRPIYDKQWRITSEALLDNSLECVWSNIPNKGNLFFWDTVRGRAEVSEDDHVIIALANAGLFGKAQAFLPESFGDCNEEWSANTNILKYELDNEGYVTKATMVSNKDRIKAIYTFTYE